MLIKRGNNDFFQTADEMISCTKVQYKIKKDYYEPSILQSYTIST